MQIVWWVLPREANVPSRPLNETLHRHYYNTVMLYIIVIFHYIWTSLELYMYVFPTQVVFVALVRLYQLRTGRMKQL